MNVELWPVARVRPYQQNPRDNEAAVSAVAESIRRFGFRQPIVVDADGAIVCGHTRWKAAQQLGLTDVPVHVARDLTPEQIRAYRIADNKTAELADWNLELLALELGELRGSDLDWTLLGFDADELAQLLGGELRAGLTDPDEIPAPPDEAVTRPGDLIILGEHRLLCGDSAVAADVDRLLDGQPVHLVNTDPPYNVRVQPRSNAAIAQGLCDFDPQALTRTLHDEDRRRKLLPKERPLVNDFLSDEEFEGRIAAWFGQLARVLAPGRSFYIWGGWTNVGNYPPALKRCGLFWHQQIIWVKNAPVLCRKDYMLAHEWCFYGWREGASHEFFGPNNLRDVWQVDKVPSQRMVHLTEKPVELAVRALQYSSRAGEHVLDLFGGSGSTLIAAEQTRRRAFLMELDPLYCDVIVQRWEGFTGRKAERRCLLNS